MAGGAGRGAQVTWRFFGTRKAVHVRPAGTGAPALLAHAASLLDQVRAAQAGSGSGGLGSGLRRGRTGREQPAGDQQLDAYDGFSAIEIDTMAQLTTDV
jgi:hypothetical protein